MMTATQDVVFGRTGWLLHLLSGFNADVENAIQTV